MSRKVQTIYEYFKEYSEEMIDKVISDLNPEDKKLLVIRYGEDLHNPCSKEELSNTKYNYQFYKVLIPKIRTLLETEKEKDIVKAKEEERKDIVQESIKEDPKKVEISSIPTYTIYDLNNYKVLIDLINKNVSNADICKQLNITFSELTSMLLAIKNLCVSYQRKYYSNGMIQYVPISKISCLKNNTKQNQEETILTDKFENEIRIVASSDFHYGNSECRQDLIEKAFDYCVLNGIHIIMCGGDLLDGVFTKGTQIISDPYEQVKYFLENYPHDDSILTFSVGGDHDLSILNSACLDLSLITSNYRPDVIIPGYNNSFINLKNDKIHLYHHIDNGLKFTSDAAIMLHGHSHNYSIRTSYNGKSLDICVPSLSNILQPVPTILDMAIKFKNGFISEVCVKQIMLENKPIVLGEFNYYKDNNTVGPINNTENYQSSSQVKTNTDNKFSSDVNRASMSQIEKFNKRYGI